MTEQTDTWLLIDVACAECRWDDSPPLVRILSVHKSAEDAKLAAEAEVRKPTWKPHPQGGEFFRLRVRRRMGRASDGVHRAEGPGRWR